MTSKIYKSAQGKSIDLGTIILQNEHVRAVGNMKVNARGDKLDSNNQIIETKPKQIQRQNAQTTNVSADPVHTSAVKAKKARKKAQEEAVQDVLTQSNQNILDPVADDTPTPVAAPPTQDIVDPSVRSAGGGLAAAIARSREIKQELDKTPRQQAQTQGLRKI